jgi:hypothetical protein
METNIPTALVIGNGPSVDALNPALLPKFTTFGANHISKKFAAWGRPTDNIVITDSFRLREIGRAYADYAGGLFVGDERRIIPDYTALRAILGRDFVPLRQLVKPKLPKLRLLESVVFPKQVYPLIFDKARFPFSFEAGLNFGYSVVSAAIQIAVIQGFKRILLTGVDSTYATPKSYFAGMEDKVQYVNNTFIENPRLWMEPILVNLQICLEDRNVKLIDCTPGGKLRFIDKGTLEEFASVTTQP